MQQRTLDWVPSWDPKNANFLIATMDCFANGKAKTRPRWKKKVWLDQGSEGACAGFGTAHVVAANPLGHDDITNELARALYHEAQRQDEFPGEAYSGTTVNGVMKAAQLLGYISEWRWCTTMAEIKHAVSYHGPLVIGVPWYDGMYDPDEKGILHVTGTQIGGHALMLAGYKVVSGAVLFRLENSWGADWGNNGGCWISEFDLERLLQEQGEFACPKKIPL